MRKMNMKDMKSLSPRAPLRPGSLSSRLALLPPNRSYTHADRLARYLGWFSLALGAVELFAPRRVTRRLGVEGREGLVRAYGAREIASGIGALSVSKTPALWSRVGGDALDVATLAALLPSSRRRGSVLLALGVCGALAAVDWACARALASRERRPDDPGRDYADRSGFPRAPAQMRGTAATGRTALRPDQRPAADQPPGSPRPSTPATTAVH